MDYLKARANRWENFRKRRLIIIDKYIKYRKIQTITDIMNR